MNANLWTQLIIAIVPALITGIGSLFIALKKCKSDIIWSKATGTWFKNKGNENWMWKWNFKKRERIWKSS